MIHEKRDALRAKGQAAAQELVENNPQAVEIRSLVHDLPAGLLRREVLRSAVHHALPGQARARRELRDWLLAGLYYEGPAPKGLCPFAIASIHEKTLCLAETAYALLQQRHIPNTSATPQLRTSVLAFALV